MPKLGIVIPIALALALLNAPVGSVSAQANDTGVVEGVVLNANGHHGIQGAELRFHKPAGDAPLLDPEVDKTVTAGEDGNFHTSLPEGAYNLTVTATGYDAHTERVVVNKGETVRLKLPLKPQTHAVTVRVEDAGSGDGVPNATVSVSGSGDHTTITTDGAGAADARLPSGRHWVRVSHPDYPCVSEERALDGPATWTFTLEAAPPKDATVRGRVTDAATGKPLAGVTVSANDHVYYAEPAVREESPDAAGGDGSSGDSGDSGSSEAGSTEEASPPPGDASSGSDGNTSSTTASDGSGDRLASPSIMPACGWGHRGGSTLTDANGEYELPVYEGGVSLNVHKDGYAPYGEWFEVARGETATRDVKLEKYPDKSVTVKGRVLDQDGDPVPGASVSFNNPKWGMYEHATADKSGAFEAHIAPGYTTIHVYAHRECTESKSPDGSYTRECGPEYHPIATTRTYAANETVTERFTAHQRPAPDATVSGYVLDADTGEPIAGAQVSLSNHDANAWGHATTDQHGSYKIRARHGYHTVSVWAEGHYHYQDNLVVRAGEDTPYDARLTPGEGERYHAYGRAECLDCDTATSHAGAPADGASAGGNTSQEAATGAPDQGRQLAAGDGATNDGAGGGEAIQYADLGGGLGPYDADERARVMAEHHGERDTPAPGALLVGALVAGLAVAVRRRQSR